MLKSISKDLILITEKLKLVIPKVRFNNKKLNFVVDSLKRTTRDLDPKKEGLNVIVGLGIKANPLAKVNIDVDQIPAGEVIRNICKQRKNE